MLEPGRFTPGAPFSNSSITSWTDGSGVSCTVRCGAICTAKTRCQGSVDASSAMPARSWMFSIVASWVTMAPSDSGVWFGCGPKATTAGPAP